MIVVLALGLSCWREEGTVRIHGTLEMKTVVRGNEAPGGAASCQSAAPQLESPVFAYGSDGVEVGRDEPGPVQTETIASIPGPTSEAPDDVYCGLSRDFFMELPVDQGGYRFIGPGNCPLGYSHARVSLAEAQNPEFSVGLSC